ncbi:MAG: ribbon-helix-helix domain-containing protein [Pseudomonadota bacterium]
MLRKRSLSLSGHRTSIALEPEFWQAMEDIAKSRELSLSALIADIDRGRPDNAGLAQALRVYALNWYRSEQHPRAKLEDS